MAKQEKKAESTATVDSATPKATVITSFRDIDNFDKEWKVGDDVTHFTAERKAKCEAAGLIEIEKPESVQEPEP